MMPSVARLALPAVTVTSPLCDTLTPPANVAVSDTDVALVVSPLDNESPHDSDTADWNTSVYGVNDTALAGTMAPLPAASHTDTDSDEPNVTSTLCANGDTCVNDPATTDPPDTWKSDAVTPLTLDPNVAVTVAVMDDVADPATTSPLRTTDGAYVNATALDAALAGATDPLAADTDTTTAPDDPSDTSTVYTPPPTAVKLPTVPPVTTKSEADRPVTSLPNVAVTTIVVALVTLPSLGVLASDTVGVYTTDTPPTGVANALAGATPDAPADMSKLTSATSPVTANVTS